MVIGVVSEATELTGNYSYSLTLAKAAEQDGDWKKAEMHFEHAIYEAQTEFGSVNVNLADCIIAFANFLEGRKRYTDAMFRFRLAEVMYQALHDKPACTRAAEGVVRMQQLAAEQGKAQGGGSGQIA